MELVPKSEVWDYWEDFVHCSSLLLPFTSHPLIISNKFLKLRIISYSRSRYKLGCFEVFYSEQQKYLSGTTITQLLSNALYVKIIFLHYSFRYVIHNIILNTNLRHVNKGFFGTINPSLWHQCYASVLNYTKSWS